MNVIAGSDPSNFLRLSLRANAFFSTFSGASFLLARNEIAALLGEIPALAVFSVGLQLLLFAGALLWLASRPEISIPLTMGVIVADGLWVVGTGVVVYAGLFARGGEILALVLADVVLVLAVLQMIGVRRIARVEAQAHS